MRRPVAVVVAGLTLALAGCFPAGEPVVESTFPATPLLNRPLVPITADAVLEYCPDTPAEHFEGFTAYEGVYICRADEHHPTDGVSTYGPWQSAYRVLDPQELLERYSLPDETRIVTGTCPDGDQDPLIVWVHARGTVQAIYAPVNGCGYARGKMVDVYQNAERDLIVEVDGGAQ